MDWAKAKGITQKSDQSYWPLRPKAASGETGTGDIQVFLGIPNLVAEKTLGYWRYRSSRCGNTSHVENGISEFA